MTVITIRYTIIQASRGVVFTEILTPEYVPERLTDRKTLWNEVEHVERNNRAQLAYSFDIARQNELTLEENIRLAKEFCQEQFVVRGMIVDLAVHEGKSDNEEEFVKKVQSCADIARRDREMAEADTSGRSEEKSEKQTKFPAFHAAQTEDIFEESGKAEQQPVNQQEKKPEKKTSLLRKLDEKKKECAVRDAKQQAVKKKRNHEMSL